MSIASVIGNSIVNQFRRIKTQSFSVEEGYQVTPFGFDSKPIKGLKGVRGRSEKKMLVLGYIQKAVNELEDGDSIQFSKNGEGELTGKIISRNDDTIEILGTGDFLIRFNEMKSAFDTMKSDLNNISTQFNVHTHPTAGVGAPSPPTPVPSEIPITPSTVSMDGAKHESIKTTEKP